ncbi:hypothetical protein E7Z53_08120 [Kocuria salina]|uniref:phage tail protein n=1 Tax=Kocuria salina TaxID=1929416 RepID=UPI0015945AED|nr:hypothetical protein [Kocuria salina]NVC23407.1 hypothetical protein [Kocuria salina]
MEAKEVGRLGVRALPDTTNFRRDLLEKLKGIEKRARIQVKAVLDGKDLARDVERTVKAVEKSARVTLRAVLDDDGLLAGARRATEKAQESARRNPVQVPVVSEMDKAFRSRISSDVRKAVSGVEALIPATVEGERLRSEIAAQVDRIQDQVKAEIPVEPEKAAAFRAKIAKMVSDVEDRAAKIRVDAETAAAKQRLEDLADEAEKRDIHLPVNVDAALAAARIAALTRDRLVTIRTRLEGSSFAATAGALAGLSGARVLGDLGSSVRNLVTNLDRSLPSVAGLTLAIATLSATALAGVSNLVALGGSLAAIIPAALALPGILAGFAVGTGVLIAALVDVKDVLGDLGPGFSALQDSISTAFWARAAQPIRDLANSVLPILQDKLTAISHEFGVMGAAIANTLNTPLGRGQLGAQLEYLRESVDIAGEGASYLTTALMTLGTAGASYLPALASWFNQITERFDTFIQTAAGDGSLHRWIRDGITNLQDLGRVIANASGILAGLSRAAANAGGASLGALADGLARVNAAINGPVWQGALTTVFAGAHAAMAALAPGVSALGDAFISLAPALATIMVLAGQAASALLEGLGTALSSPALQSGATAMFAGILAGIRALQPAFPALGAAVGSLLSVLGSLAATIGPVLGAALQALAPVFISLLAAVQPIIPVLGSALISVVQALAPILVAAANAVQAFATQFPGLSAVLVVVGAAVAAMVPLVVSLLGTLATIAPVITAVAGSFAAGGAAATALSTVMTVLGTAVRLLLGPWGLLAAAFVAAAFVAAVASSAPLREQLATLGTTLWELATTVGTALMPIFQQLTAAVMPALVAVFQAIVPVITVAAQILLQLATMLMSVLVPALQLLLPAVEGAFNGAAAVITGALTIITGLLQGFLLLLQGNWSGAWAAVRDSLSQAWSQMSSIVSGQVAAVASTIVSVLSSIVSAWSAGWSTVVSAVSSALASVVSFVASGIASVQSAWSSGMAALQAAASAAWSAVTSLVVSAMSALVSAVVSGASNVVSQFQAMGSNAVAAVSGFVGQMVSVGTNLVQGLIDGIVSMAGSVADRARSVVQGAVDAAKSALGIKSPSRVFMKIGNYTVAGLVKGLTGSQSKAEKAAGDMAKAIHQQYKKTFPDAKQFQRIVGVSREQGANNFLRSHVATELGILERYAAQRDKLTDRLKASQKKLDDVLKDRNKYRDSLAETLAGGFSLSAAANGEIGLERITQSAQDALAQIRTLRSQISQLGKLGVPKGLIDEIAQLGGEKGSLVAEQLLKGPRSQLKELSKTYTAIQSESAKTAGTVADQMYGVGVDAARGLVKGIESQLAAVDRASKTLADRLTKKVRTYLGIHSPSRVFMRIGEQTGDGMVLGLDHRVKAVQRSMAAMVAPPSPVAPERDGRLGGAGLPPINLTVPAREGEDPSRVGRRAGEALAFELGKWV